MLKDSHTIDRKLLRNAIYDEMMDQHSKMLGQFEEMKRARLKALLRDPTQNQNIKEKERFHQIIKLTVEKQERIVSP